MSNLKYSRSYERAKKYLAEVKEANTDLELLMAGHNLLESWHGYGDAKNANCGLNAIEFITKENKK